MTHHVWRLSERVEDNLGLACTGDGLFLGHTPLIERRNGRFVVRERGEIERLLSCAYRSRDLADRLLPGLEIVAKALNVNDRCLAHIAAVHLRQPDLPNAAARDALEAEDILLKSVQLKLRPASGAIRKASPDDPKHPGWPARTEGARGGQFRPKTEAELTEAAAAEIKRKTLRRAIKSGALTLLRMAVEGGEGLIPIVGIAGDIALLADLANTIHEFYKLKIEADAAIAFVQHGPYSFKELQAVSVTGYEQFSSYDAFYKNIFLADLLSKRFGRAGDGWQYHHIVTQGGKNEDNISASELQNTDNIIRLPTLIHEAVTAEYAKLRGEDGMTRQQWLQTQPYEVQKEEGLKILRELHILK